MFACLYLPDFPVQAVVRCHPHLHCMEQAVAVVGGTAPLLTVVSASSKARELKVTLHMSKTEAEMAGAAVYLRSGSAEAAAHAALRDCAYAFSPRVEDTAPDTVIADLRGLERLLGPVQKIAGELTRRAGQLGLETNVAVASNPDAAMHAARGFSGTTVVPAGKEAARLGPLPIEVLQPSPEMQETLDLWGVRNLRALAALPALAISQRLGTPGLQLQTWARGEGRRPLVPAEAPMEFEEVLELESAIEFLEPLGLALDRMLEQLCARLAARSLATQELHLRLELDDLSGNLQPERKTHERILRFPLPLQNAKVFLKLLQLDLQTAPPGAPVRKIHLQAAPSPPRAAQSGLFMPLSLEPEKMELVLARVAAVAGKENVGSPEILDTHRPDAFRMRRFNPPVARENTTSQAAHKNNLRMALRIFRPPIAARVETEAKSGAPLRVLFLAGRDLRSATAVVGAAGPWRTAGEWWNVEGEAGEGWARDEWDVALEAQSAEGVQSFGFYRMYREQKSGRWFVEGSYD